MKVQKVSIEHMPVILFVVIHHYIPTMHVMMANGQNGKRS
jgi:hypothetical protein